MKQQSTHPVSSDSRSARTWMNEVYDELRQMAAVKMARMKPGQTLQPTALVHEAWLKLANLPMGSRLNRTHFFATAAEAMRQILTDKARRKHATKRGGGLSAEEFDETVIESPAPDDELLAVHEMVDALVRHRAQVGEVVKLRYFVGLTHAEIAEMLNVTVHTVENDWKYGRAWLKREIDRRRHS